MPRKDPEARRQYQTEYARRRYHSDDAFRSGIQRRTRARNIEIREQKKALVAAFKAGGCSLCPEREPCALAAHHRDPSQKLFAVGDRSRMRDTTVEKFAAELAKCICLCHNCHSKLHAGILSL